MDVLFKQKPMNKKKTPKQCSRCNVKIKDGEDYNLKGRNVVCNLCVKEDEYLNRDRCYASHIETFGYNGNEWNISDIISEMKKGREFRLVKIKTEKLRNANEGIFIDPKIVPTVDTSIPGIIAEFPNSGWLIIDGHHRIEKAIEEGKDDVEFYLLSFKESIEFLLYKDRKELISYITARI